MDIIKYDIYSGPNIGIYTKVNDNFLFLSSGFSAIKSKKLSEYLQTDIITTSVANTRLLGILMAVNNHGILLPRTCSQDELEELKKKTDLNNKISQAFEVSNNLTIKPPQLKQKPPNNMSI